jgi:hypothetical protein
MTANTSKANFITFLTAEYAHLFTTPAYAVAAARTTPAALAEKMTQGLIDGTADKDGAAIKSAYKAMGVKHTYKAIREHLAR